MWFSSVTPCKWHQKCCVSPQILRDKHFGKGILNQIKMLLTKFCFVLFKLWTLECIIHIMNFWWRNVQHKPNALPVWTGPLPVVLKTMENPGRARKRPKKSRESCELAFLSALPTSQVIFFTDKPWKSIVHCFYNIDIHAKWKKNLQDSFFILYEKVNFWVFHKLWKNCLADFFFTL